jgi:hypothetical protein
MLSLGLKLRAASNQFDRQLAIKQGLVCHKTQASRGVSFLLPALALVAFIPLCGIRSVLTRLGFTKQRRESLNLGPRFGPMFSTAMFR